MTISPMTTAAEVQRRLGRKVRIHRERVGLTQVELAEAIGLDASTIRAVETGRRGCSLHVLVNLATQLGVAPGELLEARALRRGPGTKAEEAGQIVASLDATDQSTAIELLRVLRRRARGSSP